MNIKRTSYFTFLVAITTLATATSYGKVKGQPQACNKIAAEAILLDNSQLYDIFLNGGNSAETPLELAKALTEKGLKAGKFKLEIDPSGTLSVYLVIDKDYKGPVSASIFDHDSQREYGSLALLTAVTTANSSFAYPNFDKRAGIAIKNRILRE